MRKTFLETFKALYVLLCACCFLLAPTLSRGQFNTTPHSEQLIAAQELFLDGEFEKAYKVLEGSVQEFGEDNGSMLYMKIMCLHELYEQSNELALELEKSLTSYFNRYTIENTPQFEYENVVGVLLDFSVFRATDSEVFNNFTMPISGSDTLLYQNRIQKINTYLQKNLHSFHRDSLRRYSEFLSDSLSKTLNYYKRIRFDNYCWNRTHNTGKFSILELGYNFYQGTSEYKGISSVDQVGAFLSQGESESPLTMPVQSFDLSAVNIGFNLPHGNRWKVSILYSVAALGIQKWKIDNDSIIMRPHDRGNANFLVNFNIGQKVGIMNSWLIAPKTQLSLYYTFNPGFSFFTETYSFIDEDQDDVFIVPNWRNVIIRHETGIRLYLRTSMYLGICYQFGEYGWLNSLSSASTVNVNEKLRSRIPYQLIGARIGF